MKTLGAILVLVGAILLLKELNPSFLELLRPYALHIKDAFWGVTLIALGLYLLTKRALRKAVLLAYVVYLILYLVV